MVRPIAGGLIAAALMAGCASVASARALADPGQIAFKPCADSNNFGCGHLRVPLAPGTGAPGSITLAIRRHRAPVGDAQTAVIALAGGPGQAALPFSEQFATLLGPIISSRDLIVFDQRGTGLSRPLSCHRFEQAATNSLTGRAVAECAAQIGPSRADYTTADSVADIEAIRAAGGYEKLVLYGTSYGTKLAEQYAQAYPNRVEALVLDSVVPANGPDPLNRSTFAAIPRVLSQLCAARACAGITPNPAADLWQLVAELAHRDLHGRWIDGDGHGHRIGISANVLVEVLLDGDLEPTLRAEFPAAVRTAIHGDTAALARLLERASGVESENEGPGGDFDVPLYFATTCEEELFPWSRAAGPETRLAEAAAQIGALPSRSIAPFTPATVLGISDFPACAFWPYQAPAPVAEEAPLPAVPSLILSGADDLRTPTANAREVAAQIPGSHLLVVPDVGHSVLGSDFGGCSEGALQALFAGKPIKSCPAAPLPPLLRPSPDPPARLADVAPSHGTRGRAGRTLDAVVLTVADCERQLALKLVPLLASGQAGALGSLRVGGLRAGWGEATHEALLLRRYSYVSGVTVSGRLTASEVVLHVGGPAAAAGTLRLARNSSLSGVLGGVGVHLDAVLARRLDVGAATAASAVLSRRASAGASAIRSSGPRAPSLAFAAR
jgi:pimeloyl-ACP methyl ester carboxylesterase